MYHCWILIYHCADGIWTWIWKHFSSWRIIFPGLQMIQMSSLWTIFKILSRCILYWSSSICLFICYNLICSHFNILHRLPLAVICKLHSPRVHIMIGKALWNEVFQFKPNLLDIIKWLWSLPKNFVVLIVGRFWIIFVFRVSVLYTLVSIYWNLSFLLYPFPYMATCSHFGRSIEVENVKSSFREVFLFFFCLPDMKESVWIGF